MLAIVAALARTATRTHLRRAPRRRSWRVPLIPRDTDLPNLPWGNSSWGSSPRPPTGLADGFGPEQPYGGPRSAGADRSLPIHPGEVGPRLPGTRCRVPGTRRVVRPPVVRADRNW